MGVYEKKDLIFVAKVKERLRAADPGRILSGAQGAANGSVSIQKPAREKGLAVGRIVNGRENARVPMDKTETRLPGCLRRMDGRRTLEALHLCRDVR